VVGGYREAVLNLREVAGVAVVSGNLGMAEWSERAVDRIAALGAAGKVSTLGESLWRWLYGGCHRSAEQVREILAAKLRAYPLTAARRARIATYAMHEFSNQRCPLCHGAREATLADGKVIVCEGCAGTGLNRFTNGDRARACGVHPRDYESVEKPLELALDLLRRADSITNVAVAIELERGQRATVASGVLT
jgi:hypothetical protein